MINKQMILPLMLSEIQYYQ